MFNATNLSEARCHLENHCPKPNQVLDIRIMLETPFTIGSQNNVEDPPHTYASGSILISQPRARTSLAHVWVN